MITFVALLLALVVIGAPLFVIVGTATTLAFFFFAGVDHHSIAGLVPVTQNMESLLKQETFLAIPLFMASGAIMTAGGIAERLVRVFKAGLGWLPGGMAIAAIAACMFFAAISGSSPVTLIAVGTIMFPAMKKSGYPENFSLGMLTTAGSLGCLLPPSISILIYAISISSTSAAVDPQDMFLAGIPAALFVGTLLAIYAFRVGLKSKETREKFSARELGEALKGGFWALLLPVVVLGGIYGGFCNPSEAGGVATVYALVITTLIYKELPWKKLMAALADSASLMGSLILIIVLAFGLNQFLAEIEIQDRLMTFIREAHLGPVGFMLLVNGLLIVIGALMDSISCTLIFAPMLAPVAHQL
jgi:C4-dicarboxylate transporter DctM subunit